MVFKITSVAAAALLVVVMAGCDGGSSGGGAGSGQVREVKPGSVEAPGTVGGPTAGKTGETAPPTKK